MKTVTFGDVLYRLDTLFSDDTKFVCLKNGDDTYLVTTEDDAVTPVIYFPPSQQEFWAEFMGRRQVNGKQLNYYRLEQMH